MFGTSNNDKTFLLPEDITGSISIDKTFALTSGTMAEDELKKLEKDVSQDWKEGDLIMGLYDVIKILGEGSFGKVYRVRHRIWNRDLAVKSLHSELAGKESQREAFIKECEGWVNLGLHPNVVTAYYVRSLGGLPGIFLEYIDGGDLAERIKEGTLKGLEEILDISIQCLDGLSFAHSKGLVHRDIKPLNCLLTAGGELKITDFGIAEGLSKLDITSKEDLSGKTVVTEGGSAGTPAYMPPEQWSSQHGPVGQWSDIYAFGIMLYEMCCRRRPFGEDGTSLMVLKAHHLTVEPPHPSEFNRDIPEVLSEFILKCLKKKPEERFQTGKEARKELAGIYKTLTGKDYPGKSPEEIELRADSLNNRAVSLIDLGKGEEALKIWEEALRIESHHGESVYNSSLVLWRSGRKGDHDALSLLEEAGKSGKDRGKIDYFLSLIHLERGDYGKALGLLEGIKGEISEETGVYLDTAKKLSPSAPGCINTLQGHIKEIVSLSVSENGRFLLSGGRDNTVRLWDLSSGRMIRTFMGHSKWVIGVSIDSEGKKGLSGSLDDTLRLWDLTTGQCIRIFDERVQVNCLSLSKDGLIAVSGQEYGTVKVWDTGRGKCLKTLEGHTGRIQSVSISSDGKRALSGSDDLTIKVWDLEKGTCLKTLEGHEDKINSVFLSPHGKMAISGSKDKTIRIWDTGTGRCIKILHTFFVNSVALSPDGKWALSGDDNCAVKLWEMTSGRCIRTFEGHSEFVISVLFGKDGKTAISGSYDRTIKVLDISPYTEKRLSFYAPLMLCRVKRTEESAGAQTGFSRLMEEGKKAFSKGKYKDVLTLIAKARAIEGYERDPEALELLNRAGSYVKRKGFKGAWEEKSFNASAGVSSISLSMDGKVAVSGGSDKNLTVWNLPGGNFEILEGHNEDAHYVSLTQDGKQAFSRSNDQTLRLWDIYGKKCIKSVQIFNICSIAISSDGKWGAAGGDRTIKLFALPSGRSIRTFSGHTGIVQALAISTDGRRLLSGSNDEKERLRLWDMATGKFLRAFDTFYVNTVALSFCGNYGLAGCAEAMDKSKKTLTMWDINSGKPVQDFGDFREEVRSVALSPDGKWAVSGGKDYKVRIWEISSGKCLRVLEGHKDIVTSVAISGDCRWILSGSRDRTVKLWQLDWEFEYCDPQSWSPEAEPYVKNFLVCHTPYQGILPEDREPSEEEINKTLARKGNPVWTDEDFEKLLVILRYGGYGWIRPEGVKEKLGKPLLPDRGAGEVSSVVSNKFPGRSFVKKAFCDAKNLYLMENITKSFVTSVSISEDGGKLLVGSFENLPLSLDLSTGRADVNLEGTTSGIGFAVLNKDGKLALSRTSDRILSLWDMTRGKVIRTFEGHTFDINSFAISPDNRFVISCSGDKTVRLWDLNTGRVIRTITGHRENITAVAFSPDGRYVISGGFDKAINLWDLATGKCIKVFSGHSFYIRSLSWSGDMKKILSGSEDKTLKLWDASTGNCIRTLEGHSGSVTSASMTQDGKWAVSGSRDKTVKLWNTETGECIRTFEEHSALIQDVAVSKDGSILVSGGSDNKVVVRELLWQFQEVSPGNWTEDARPYINSFLYIHTGKDCKFPDDREPSEEEINKAFSRQGLPVWTEWDGEQFLETLKYAGFGWIKPEEVKKELEKALPRPIEINEITLPLSAEKLDVNRRDGEGKTPLIKAIEINEITLPLSTEKVDVNKRDGEWKTPLIRAVEKGDLSEVKNLLEKGADPSLADRFGISPLHRASIKNRSDIAQLLLEKGVKTDIEDIDGKSPLHWVKGAETAEVLIKKGADVNKRDKRKQTPLITAAMDGSVEVIKTLVKHGGDINGQDETNYAPLHWTVVSKQTEAAKLLLSLGANTDIKDNFNRTPLELAESHGAKEIASIIKDFVSKKPAAGPAPSSVKPPAEEKAKVCDVCSKPLSGNEGTLYKPGDFRNIVSKGFEPGESFISMMTNLGLKRDVIIKQWQEQTVFPSPSDWLLCGECAGRAKKFHVPSPSITSDKITVPCNLKNVNHLRTIGGKFTPDMLIGGLPLQKLFGSSNLETHLHRLVSDSSGDKEALHTLLSSFPSHIDTIYSVALSPDGKKILSGGIDTTVKLWDSDTGMLLKTLGGHTFNVYSIVFSNDGSFALSAGGDNIVKVWNLSTCRCIKTLSHSDQVHSVALSSDGKTAISGSFDTTLKVWDISSGTCLKTLEGHTNRVYSVALSGDGAVALSGSYDNTVRLWDVSAGKCLKVFKDHSDNVECVAISPDGTTGASGSRDRTIRVWNLKKQKCVKVLKGHTSTVSTLFIDSYGKWLISGCCNDTELPGHKRDNTIRFWNIAGGKCVKTIEGNSQRVYSAVMSRDGRRLASGGMDSSINVWNLEWEYKEESQDTWVSKVFGFFKK